MKKGLRFNFPKWQTLLVGVGVIFCQTGRAQQNVLVSQEDAENTIRTVTLLQWRDNLKGVYSEPLTLYMNELLRADKQWSFISPLEPKNIDEDLFENPQMIQSQLRKFQVDALVWGQVQKGPKGLKIQYAIFTKSGRPLVFQEIEESEKFSLEYLREKLGQSWKIARKAIPYGGLIMSRQGLNVTINLGREQGVREMEELSVVQILHIKRHPVRKFMVGFEKEVVGKIKVTQTQERLSFGQVIFEKEPDFVAVNSKVLLNDFVEYINPVIAKSDAQDLAFGKQPQAWLPRPEAQFGKLTFGVGISNYEYGEALRTTGTVSTNASFAPNLYLATEVWLNPLWSLDFRLRQATFGVSNPLSGSTPSKVSVTLGQYLGAVGYNFISPSEGSGSRLRGVVGFSNSQWSVSGTNPVAMTNMNYSGVLLRFEAGFPIETESHEFDLGLGFDWHLFPRVSENLSSGGSSESRNYSFDVFLGLPWDEAFNLKFDLKVESWNSEFSGMGDRSEPARNITQSLTSLSGYLEYLF